MFVVKLKNHLSSAMLEPAINTTSGIPSYVMLVPTGPARKPSAGFPICIKFRKFLPFLSHNTKNKREFSTL